MSVEVDLTPAFDEALNEALNSVRVATLQEADEYVNNFSASVEESDASEEQIKAVVEALARVSDYLEHEWKKHV